MTDEFETEDNQTNIAEKRISELSGKVRLTSKERDEQIELVKQRDIEIELLKKDNEFQKGFTTTTSKYPQASQFQDKIKELVVRGYDVEDAAVAVLNKEGKLLPLKIERETVAGGSATTNAQPAKSPADLIKSGTREERRKVLEETLINR